MNVEFVDRYGEAGPPSWLRACFGQCEGTGRYPVFDPATPLRRGDCRPKDDLTAYERRAIDLCKRRTGVEADGWYFILCPDCHGSGRVSWPRTFARIPSWLVRGVRTMYEFRPSAPMHVPEWSYGRRLWLAFKVAFLCDLGMRP